MQTPITAAAVGLVANRSGLTYPQFRTVCRMFLDRAGTHPVGGVEVVHLGDGPAADTDFTRLARWMRPNPRVVLHSATLPAAEPPGLAVTVEPAATPSERNRAIVDAADLLVACPREAAEDVRSGTWSTIRYARTGKKRVLVVYPDGLVGCGGRVRVLVEDRDTLAPVWVFLKRVPESGVTGEKVLFEPLQSNGPLYGPDGDPVRPIVGRSPDNPLWYREFPTKKALLRAGYLAIGPHQACGSWREYAGGRAKAAGDNRWAISPAPPAQTPPPAAWGRKKPAANQKPEPLPLD